MTMFVAGIKFLERAMQWKQAMLRQQESLEDGGVNDDGRGESEGQQEGDAGTDTGVGVGRKRKAEDEEIDIDDV